MIIQTKRMRLSVASLCTCLTMGLQAGQAQDTIARQVHYLNTLDTPAPHIVIRSNKTADFNTLKWNPGNGAPPVTLVMPFQRAGGSSVTGFLQSEILVSGWKLDGTGVICRLTFDLGNLEIAVVQTLEYPGIDPYTIVATGSRLFVMDLSNNRILTTPYEEGNPLPAPQDFELVVSFPGKPIGMEIVPLFDEAGELMQESCEYSALAPFGGRYLITPSPSNGWMLFDPEETGEEAYSGPYVMNNPASVGSFGPIELWGKVGNYEVKNIESGLTVASGVVTDSTLEFTAIPTQEMDLGRPHAVMSSTGVSVSNIFYPTVRYGTPVGFPLARLERGSILGGRLREGVSFTTNVWLGFDDLTIGQQTLPVTVWWNWRDENTGQDPVVILGQSAQLIGAVGSRDLTLSVGKDRIGDTMSVELPIPFFQGLLGKVLLFQWATITPGPEPKLVLSDVYGSEILPLTGEQSSSSSTQPAIQNQMSIEDMFRAASLTLNTDDHDLLRSLVKTSADRLTKGLR